MQIYASPQSDILTEASKGPQSYPVGSINYAAFEEEHTFPQYEGPVFGTGVNLLSNFGPSDNPKYFDSPSLQGVSVSCARTTVVGVPGPNSIVLLTIGILMCVILRRLEWTPRHKIRRIMLSWLLNTMLTDDDIDELLQ